MGQQRDKELWSEIEAERLDMVNMLENVISSTEVEKMQEPMPAEEIFKKYGTLDTMGYAQAVSLKHFPSTLLSLLVLTL